MSNTLRANMFDTIKQLGAKGWGIRRISKELNVHRNTMRNHLEAGSNRRAAESVRGV
jgi:lambda repressor-like predicted transcriptional regulator